MSALYFPWQDMIVVSWAPKNQGCATVHNHSTYTLLPFFHISWSPFCPSYEWIKCWLLPFSNFQSISILWDTWFVKMHARLGIMLFNPYIWLETTNTPICCFYPWSNCCCFLKLLIFYLWVFLRLFLLFFHIRSFFITTIIRTFFYLTFSGYFFFLDLIATIFMVPYTPPPLKISSSVTIMTSS